MKLCIDSDESREGVLLGVRLSKITVVGSGSGDFGQSYTK